MASCHVPPSPLLWNLLLFTRLLRRLGIPVAANAGAELVRALAAVDLGRREDVQAALRCVLIHHHDDLAPFDRAFDVFWRAGAATQLLHEAMPDALGSEEPASEDVEGRPLPAPGGRPWVGDVGESEPGGPGEGATRFGVYSPDEVLAVKDFALLSADELAQARRVLRAMRWSAGERRSLRLRPAHGGRRLDIRRSLRGSMRHGGELLDLATLGPKPKPRPLVLLCDISGSMDRYTRLLLHFLHSLERGRQGAEVFVFATRLTRITRSLRQHDPDRALAAVAGEVRDWSGGTRIGDALHSFNREWARRVLDRGAITLIISDGWDRGDPDVLAAEMQRLQRGSYRTIWLNPLLGSAAYQPLAQGMRAALPYVDDFLPVHNLASLGRLADVLNDVGARRPYRGGHVVGALML